MMSATGDNLLRERSSELTISPLDGPLGAEVRCADLSKIGPEDRDRVRQAWLDHLVLVFRDQHLSDDDQCVVTAIFGEPGTSISTSKDGPRHKVVIIANTPDGALGSGELFWHSDNSFEERPLTASLLHAIEIPPEGGDTYFNNMYLALDTLPADLRDRVSTLSIKNDISMNSAGELIGERVTDVRLAKGPSHPIIRTHPETGLNALYLGRRPNAYVNGLSLEESEELLNTLWSHATRPALEYRHQWRVGDLLVWDNRAVMHRRDAFDERQSRIMHRTQCVGNKTFHDAAADGLGSHPRGHAGA